MSLPIFPPELERDILEAAAELYPETIPDLLLVCHRVYECQIVRIKHKTVAADGEKGSYPFRTLLRAISSDSKPASFFHAHVKYLFIRDTVADEEALLDALSACKGIQSLALLHRKLPLSISLSLGAVRPRRLAVHLKSLSDCIDLCRPMFALVTHLTVLDGFIFDSAAEGWTPFLAQLPSLTHLALHYGFHVLADLLESCEKLQVLVFLHRIPAGQRMYLNSVEDPRFVFMALPIDDQVDDWVLGTRGGNDVWARADAFVAKKLRGEIEPRARCWIEAHDGIGPGYSRN
ncbi:hypothetical protein DFH06DRAFT_560978 [Mycena polygramma]|nr:hypothetical protein DFH06DRAFT_560978 [Mycena polygramma]